MHNKRSYARKGPCRYGALNMQAGTLFCDTAFQREVATGSLSNASLDRYTCVALAGVTTGALPLIAATVMSGVCAIKCLLSLLMH